MTMERSKPWPLGSALILCGLVAISFSFFSVPCSYAIVSTCACTQTCTTSLNFGPLEVGGPALGSTANLHPACGDVGVMSIMSSDPSFTINYSSLPGPSCNGFSWNSGNQGTPCYFGVKFAPVANGSLPANGQHSTTITVTYTNNNVATGYFLNYGAAFTLSPEAHDNGSTDAFRLMYESSSSPGFGSITFDPGNAIINSQPELSYLTSSGKVPKPAATASVAAFAATATPYVIGFGTVPGGVATPDALYAIAGGQLELKSTYSAPSSAPTPIGNNPSAPNLTTGYVTGFQGSPAIPYETITSQLTSLYGNLVIPDTDPNFVISGKTTPGLLTQIAMQESANTYQQFLNPPNLPDKKGMVHYPYGITDSWPLESGPTTVSPDRGSHIGLMMVPVSMPDAWNWMRNTTDGSMFFQGSINTAYRLADDEYTNFEAVGPPTKLPVLTACQLEEMALALYGPDGGAKESMQYLVPTCVGGKVTNTTNCSGTWQWKINYPKGSTPVQKKERAAVCYVVCVRKKAHLGTPPGSASMCAGTSPLPDPPTGLKCGC